ncbi:MAG: hypothetical protein H6652_01550 [Ardenticatenaceae bacterium]|nr:hypothetical protein [Ardenticatenaceae bacterium]
MNSRERVIATLERQPTDRTPIDCWLYQKQFVEKLEAEYGTREQFLDEFNIDIFVGFVPYPNQFGRKFDVSELVDVDLGDPRDEKWLSHTDWNYDFAGLNVRQAVEKHTTTNGPSSPTPGALWKAPASSSASKTAG